MSSQRAGGARPDDGAGSNPAGGEALEARLRETAALLSVARVASSTTDFQEALRLICRELARVTGAETVSAYVRQPADASDCIWRRNSAAVTDTGEPVSSIE